MTKTLTLLLVLGLAGCSHRPNIEVWNVDFVTAQHECQKRHKSARQLYISDWSTTKQTMTTCQWEG